MPMYSYDADNISCEKRLPPMHVQTGYNVNGSQDLQNLHVGINAEVNRISGHGPGDAGGKGKGRGGLGRVHGAGKKRGGLFVVDENDVTQSQNKNERHGNYPGDDLCITNTMPSDEPAPVPVRSLVRTFQTKNLNQFKTKLRTSIYVFRNKFVSMIVRS